MKILVPVGGRSDEGLSAPVIRRLEKDKRFEVHTLQLSRDYVCAYLQVKHVCEDHKPHLVFVTGDRMEMAAAAAAAFNCRVPIAHFYAGIGNTLATVDDVHRHAITLWSSIQFCESRVAANRVIDLRSAAGIPTKEVHVVGISHLDDLQVWEGKKDIPDYKYDLVLYNPPTWLPEGEQQAAMQKDGTQISKILQQKDHGAIFVGANADRGREFVLEEVYTKQCYRTGDRFYENLERPHFLGLLKHCQRFITNSSVAIYEAPHFLPPDRIYLIGDRNRGRDRGPFERGASDKIVKILEGYALTGLA